MIVFITHPKYFDMANIRDKKDIELIFIFDSMNLYQKLSQKYQCVLLDKRGNIKQENFFPPSRKIHKNTIHGFFRIKEKSLRYFRKIYHRTKKKHFEMLQRYKDVEFDIIVAMAKKKKTPQEQLISLDNGILRTIYDILELEHGEKYLKENKIFIELLFNYIKSFYRAYVYSFSKERGAEVFSDFFRFSYLFNTLFYYRFNKRDIYQNRFHYRYLRVLSRLFIEHIHKSDVKGFVEHNIGYYKENGWW